MSINLNTVIIAGRLTRDPEIKQVGTTEVCNFSLALNEKRKDKNGEMKEWTSYVDCQAWGAVAKQVATYLLKGAGALVEGKLKSESWQTQAGEKRQKLVVDVLRVTFTTPKFSADSIHGPTADEQRAADKREPPAPNDDDPPF